MEILQPEMLKKISENAARFDQENVFCHEDIELLAEAGYLKAAVPKELGGRGFSLAQLSRSQRLLARSSPATALAANMHLLWGAVANFLRERGDDRLQWVFDDMMAGEIFAFGISEAGNDLVLLDSFCEAVPVAEDSFSDKDESAVTYKISGKKIFTTLSPVWTRLGVHAKIVSTESETHTSEIVVGFLEREKVTEPRAKETGSEWVSHPDPWDTLGMRATQSWNTQLEGYPLKRSRITAKYEPMDASDPLIMAVSLCFGVLTSSVYAGIADRALEISAEELQPQKLDDPLLATWYTEAVLQHRAAIDSLERLSADIDNQVVRDDYSIAVAALKTLVTDEARSAVDTAIRISGSKAFAASSELARLYRDVLAGIFHPRSAKSLAKSLLDALR